MIKNIVPEISIHRDFRFSLEDNWNTVADNIQECQQRGVLVTPLTVFNEEGNIIGWQLHGWKPPPARFIYDPQAESTNGGELCGKTL